MILRGKKSSLLGQPKHALTFAFKRTEVLYYCKASNINIGHKDKEKTVFLWMMLYRERELLVNLKVTCLISLFLSSTPCLPSKEIMLHIPPYSRQRNITELSWVLGVMQVYFATL